MKNIKNSIAGFVFTGLLLLGCSKENIPVFNSPASIYFTATSPLSSNTASDSTAIGFGYAPDTVKDSIVKISVSVLGKTAPGDRSYKVVADPLSTAKTGTHYELPVNPSVRAGRSNDSLEIIFHRTPDLLTAPVTLILHLQPNDNFNTDMKRDTVDQLTGKFVDYTIYKISVADGIIQPSIWNRYPRFYFGTFSVKKIKLLHIVTGMKLDALNNYDSMSYWVFWATMMNRYLIDQATAGNTILEDDGTPMKMGSFITG